MMLSVLHDFLLTALLSCLFTGAYSYRYVVISDSLQGFLMQDRELLHFIISLVKSSGLAQWELKVVGSII